MGFIYLIHVREFLHKNECVYKIGRTEHLLQRMTQYPKGSKLLFCMNVHDCKLAERDLLKLLARQQKVRVDIGDEYIEGILDNILQTMFTYIQSHNAIASDTQTSRVDAVVPRKVDPTILIMDFINGRKEELSGKTVKSRELYDQLQQWLIDNDHHVFISHIKMSRELTRLYGVGHKVCRFDTGVDQAICFSTLTCGQEQESATVIDETQEENKVKEFIERYLVLTKKPKDCILSREMFSTFQTSDLYNDKDVSWFKEQMRAYGLKSEKKQTRGQYYKLMVYSGVKFIETTDKCENHV
jgi:hypothetical protein